MTTVTAERPLAAPLANTHVDVLIVGAGISGIGAAHYLKTKLPAQVVRDPRGARRDRRHLGPVPLPGHPLGLRPAHVRLRVQAVDERQRDRGRPGDPRLPRGGGRRERSGPAHPLRPQGAARRLLAGGALDGRRASASRRVSASSSRAAAVQRRRLLRLRRPATRREFEGRETFAGTIVHPQAWPEDLDYTGKRVVVIGSGATAVTLIPAMADARRSRDDAAALPELRDDASRQGPDRQRLRRLLPGRTAYRITRRMNIARQRFIYELACAIPSPCAA